MEVPTPPLRSISSDSDQRGRHGNCGSTLERTRRLRRASPRRSTRCGSRTTSRSRPATRGRRRGGARGSRGYSTLAPRPPSPRRRPIDWREEHRRRRAPPRGMVRAVLGRASRGRVLRRPFDRGGARCFHAHPAVADRARDGASARPIDQTVADRVSLRRRGDRKSSDRTRTILGCLSVARPQPAASPPGYPAHHHARRAALTRGRVLGAGEAQPPFKRAPDLRVTSVPASRPFRRAPGLPAAPGAPRSAREGPWRPP